MYQHVRGPTVSSDPNVAEMIGNRPASQRRLCLSVIVKSFRIEDNDFVLLGGLETFRESGIQSPNGSEIRFEEIHVRLAVGASLLS